MGFEEFVKALTDRIRDAEGERAELALCTVPKNNGGTYKGVVLHDPDGNEDVTINLEECYKRFGYGETMDTIARDICRIYHECDRREGIGGMVSKVRDYSGIKGQIGFRAVNRAMNAERLEKIPYVPVLDLAVVFQIIIEDSRNRCTSILINNRLLREWGIPLPELTERAVQNMLRRFPASITSMRDILAEIRKGMPDKESDLSVLEDMGPCRDDLPMYILSAPLPGCGAGALFYPGMIRNFANLLGKDLVILPSSVHEVILLPYEQGRIPGELNELVSTVNESCVRHEDWLSDHAYLYERRTGLLGFAVSDVKETVNLDCLWQKEAA